MSKMDWMDDLRAAESGDPYFATPKGDLRRCVAERKALRRIEELEAEITFQAQCKVANRREAERLEAENGRLEAELAQERKDFREAWASYKRLREAIENAPHHRRCAVFELCRNGNKPLPCDCWKAKALGEGE